MSERVFEGLAKISQEPQRGMITLRGDLASAAVKKAVGKVPAMGQCTGDVAWMSPDELLVMCPHAELSAKLETMSKALKGKHHLIQDVSDARVIYAIDGPAARDVLAKLCPVNLSPDAFKPGQFRRTRIAQVPCAFRMREDGCFELVAFTSVADYVWGVLCAAADPAAPVGHFA